MNFDFTDKTQESIAAAIQLAKDYSHAQGMSMFRLYSVSRDSPVSFSPPRPYRCSSPK